MSPGIAKCPLGNKITPFENCQSIAKTRHFAPTRGHGAVFVQYFLDKAEGVAQGKMQKPFLIEESGKAPGQSQAIKINLSVGDISFMGTNHFRALILLQLRSFSIEMFPG